MKVIGGSITVDLSKKLTVEMTLGELAMLTAVLGKESSADVQEAISASRVISTKHASDVQRLDDTAVYGEMAAILRVEGVAE